MLRKLHLAALFLILCNVLLLCSKQIAAQSAVSHTQG